jgi:hypothetical protein
VADQPPASGKQLVVEQWAEPASAFAKAEPPLAAVVRSARVAG